MRKASRQKAKGKRQKSKVKGGEQAYEKSSSREARPNFCLLHFAFCLLPSSQYVSAEVLVFADVGERARDVLGVYDLPLGFEVGAEKTYLVQTLLHDRVKAARADVLRLLVDADGEARD